MLFEQDFHEISKREGQLRKILEKDDGSVGIAAFFQKISRKEARFGKIMENTKKVAGGRGGVKVATGKAELAVRRAWRS